MISFSIFDQDQTHAHKLFWHYGPGQNVDYPRSIYYQFVAPTLPEDPTEIDDHSFLGGVCALAHRPLLLYQIIPAGTDALGRPGHFVVAFVEVKRAEAAKRSLRPLFDLPFFKELEKQARTGKYTFPQEWSAPFPHALCVEMTGECSNGRISLNGERAFEEAFSLLANASADQVINFQFKSRAGQRQVSGFVDGPQTTESSSSPPRSSTNPLNLSEPLVSPKSDRPASVHLPSQFLYGPLGLLCLGLLVAAVLLALPSSSPPSTYDGRYRRADATTSTELGLRTYSSGMVRVVGFSSSDLDQLKHLEPARLEFVVKPNPDSSIVYSEPVGNKTYQIVITPRAGELSVQEENAAAKFGRPTAFTGNYQKAGPNDKPLIK